jgi:hypothetical protein
MGIAWRGSALFSCLWDGERFHQKDRKAERFSSNLGISKPAWFEEVEGTVNLVANEAPDLRGGEGGDGEWFRRRRAHC